MIYQWSLLVYIILLTIKSCCAEPETEDKGLYPIFNFNNDYYNNNTNNKDLKWKA